MFATKLIAAAAACLVVQSTMAADANLVDAVNVDVASGTRTQMVRVGLQSDWDQRWFQSNGTHLSGFWELSAGAWQANHYRNIDGAQQNLWDLGFTPVFRFENDNKKGMYYEGAIGVHRLSKLYDNDTYRLSTHFQFGDHVGIGYVFDNHWELAGKIQHFSNGGYKKPNTGVNFLVAKASYHF
jgi:lipid A 3-O-deacylase